VEVRPIHGQAINCEQRLTFRAPGRGSSHGWTSLWRTFHPPENQ
jgi:hypothetical protein